MASDEAKNELNQESKETKQDQTKNTTDANSNQQSNIKPELDSNPSSDSITAQDYISSQLELEREAKELMPYDPNQCTYSMGAIRQQIYACLTCLAKTGQTSGICYSCSIQCHSDHELVELFTKRNFTCDCGTTKMNHPCYLRSKIFDDIPSSSNSYNQNFKGHFCDCKQLYNPIEEKSNMLQCIFGETCQEDWFHDYCIMGLTHYEPPKQKDHGVNKLDQLGEPEIDAATQNIKNEEDKKEELMKNDQQEEENGEPVLDGFPNLDDFDCYICWKCINKFKDFFDKIKQNDDIVVTTVQRIPSENLQERNSIILQNQDGTFFKKRKIDYDYSIFLKTNYEENFETLYNTTNDTTIKKILDEFQFLMNDDPIYEPPNDDEIDPEDDDNSSIYDLGAKAINSLPREQAIQGVQAFQDIKTKLKDFLAPFAQDGKIVGKDDVENFFKNIQK